MKTIEVLFALGVTAILTLMVITLISIVVVANSDDHDFSDGPKVHAHTTLIAQNRNTLLTLVQKTSE